MANGTLNPILKALTIAWVVAVTGVCVSATAFMLQGGRFTQSDAKAMESKLVLATAVAIAAFDRPPILYKESVNRRFDEQNKRWEEVQSTVIKILTAVTRIEMQTGKKE